LAPPISENCYSDEELEKFEILWKMFAIEMVSKDDLQNDMLQMTEAFAYFMYPRLQEQTELTTFDKTIGYSTRIQLLSRKQF
jgi:hypothetical protein